MSLGLQRRFLSLLGGLGLLLVATACADPARDHPAAPPGEEGVEVVAPDLDPPPPAEGALSEEQALEIIRGAPDPSDAIRELDRRPFAFELDERRLARFRSEALDPAVLDYLEKRSKVDWRGLRGDVDPSGPR